MMSATTSPPEPPPWDALCATLPPWSPGAHRQWLATMQRCFWRVVGDEATLETMAQTACALLGRTGHLREDLMAALAFGVQAMAWQCYLRPWANAVEVATAVAMGQAVLAVAYSEPGGAPGRLQTTARPHGDGWRLSGSKHYITNGPVADWFVVFAAVAGQPQRREAFLVPATAVQVSAMEVPPLLTGLPHGRLDFCDILVPEAQRLPEAQTLAAGRRLRRAEDSLRLALLGAAVCAIVRRSTSNERQATILGGALLVEELALAALEALEAGRDQRQQALALAGLEAAQQLGGSLQEWSIPGDDDHMRLLQALPAALGRGDASRLRAGLGHLAASGGQRQDGP